MFENFYSICYKHIVIYTGNQTTVSHNRVPGMMSAPRTSHGVSFCIVLATLVRFPLKQPSLDIQGNTRHESHGALAMQQTPAYPQGPVTQPARKAFVSLSRRSKGSAWELIVPCIVMWTEPLLLALACSHDCFS